jgi:hypothetical protein
MLYQFPVNSVAAATCFIAKAASASRCEAPTSRFSNDNHQKGF